MFAALAGCLFLGVERGQKHCQISHDASDAPFVLQLDVGIVTYFSMRAVLPHFFLWARENEWANYLHSLLILAILVALWRVTRSLFTPHEVSMLTRTARRFTPGAEKFAGTAKREDVAQWRVVRNQLRRLTVRGKRESEKVIAILEEAAQIIAEHGSDKRVAQAVRKALAGLKAREHRILAELARIRQIDSKLTRFDLSQYREQKARYQHMSREQQAECKRLFEAERKKLGTEEKINELAKRATTCADQFNRCIDSACEYLRVGQSDEAGGWIRKAVERETEAASIFNELQRLEKTLLQLLGKMIAQVDVLAQK